MIRSDGGQNKDGARSAPRLEILFSWIGGFSGRRSHRPHHHHHRSLLLLLRHHRRSLLLLRRLYVLPLRGWLQSVEIAWQDILGTSLSQSVQPLYLPGTILALAALLTPLLHGKPMGAAGRAWVGAASTLAKPALAALAIFTFLGRWRAFLWPLIMIDSDSMMVLSVGLQKLSDLYTNDYGLICAGSILMLVPMITVFVFCQRWFISGIQLGSVKG